MKPQIQLMHRVWDDLLTGERNSTELPGLKFDEIISSIFTSGPFYFYVIDFFDMSISQMSAGFVQAHGITSEKINTINDILQLIHPDDMQHVAAAEKKAFDIIYNSIGVDKITRYKISYNFRFKTADGSYQLYNHQSLILTVDESGNFIKSLNIHTNINHITEQNNHTFSLIGLAGEPSFLNLPLAETACTAQDGLMDEKLFSNREVDILRCAANGLDSQSIANQLFISVETVKSHRKNMLKKSGCKNIAELVARSIGEGWI